MKDTGELYNEFTETSKEKQERMNNGVVWALPINENKEYISRNVKYHCFEDLEGTYNASESLCGKYLRHGASETEIGSGRILSNPKIACKVCFIKW